MKYIYPLIFVFFIGLAAKAQTAPVFDGKQLINVSKVTAWNFVLRPAGWYRIAKLTGTLRGNTTFELRENADHSNLRFEIGVSYNRGNGSSFTLTSHSIYSAATFTKIRTLTSTIYGIVYLEVYVNPHNNNNTVFNAYAFNQLGDADWALEDWTVGEVPAGYTVAEFDTNQLFTVGNITNKNILSVSRNGNVGIGTTTPSEKLAVNGKIRAKEVKVEAANWPDYVFREDYQLTSLTELENYIKANQHLPEMPSAKEVAGNGIELGEMNKLLVKKIEELTLYLIEKDKDLLKDREKIASLEASIKIINEKLSQIK